MPRFASYCGYGPDTVLQNYILSLIIKLKAKIHVCSFVQTDSGSGCTETVNKCL